MFLLLCTGGLLKIKPKFIWLLTHRLTEDEAFGTTGLEFRLKLHKEQRPRRQIKRTFGKRSSAGEKVEPQRAEDTPLASKQKMAL